MANSFQPTRMIATDPGEGVNEDVGGSVAQAAWVLDGSTGVGQGDFTPGETDAQWYVQQFDRFLRAEVEERETDLPTIVKRGIRTVAAEFADLTEDLEDEIGPAARPSATGAITRWTGTALEVLILGDCSVVLQPNDGEAQHLTGDNSYAHRLEQAAERSMHQLMTEQRSSAAQAREQIWPQLRKDRWAMRESDECWGLGMDPEAADHATHIQFDCSRLGQMYIMSDGFSRIVDKFGLCSDWQQATDWIAEQGIERAFERLRTIEQKDSDCTSFPRIKTHDDVAIASVVFS
jgi:serine/threonine protein phosphatase PrpC